MDVEVLLSSERPIPADAVRALYDAVGWFPERTGADIEAVLAENLAVGAWLGDRLVGFARAISDRRIHAYIDDVVVDPEHQLRGIGGALVKRLLDALADVREVSLFCGEENVSFYETLGFRVWESQRVLHTRPRSTQRR